MTVAMQAVAVRPGPRVLRIGIVHSGRVIEDRIVTDRSTVTVGASEGATLVIPHWSASASAALGDVGARVPLFERSGDGYVLPVVPGMRGRIALATGIVDLANPRAARIALTEDARGKILLGDTTVLFQFVPLPLPPSRPQLPLAIKGALASPVDWNLTILAAFSFLVHFGVVGSMYSDWMDPIVDTRATAGGIVEMVKNLPSAPLEIPTDSRADETAPASPSAPTPAAVTTPKPVAPTAVSHPLAPSDVAALSAALDAIGISALAALHADGSAVKNALDGRDVPPVDLGDPAASNVGVRAASGNDLHLGPGSNGFRLGTTSTKLSELTLLTADPRTSKSDHERDVGGPSSGVTYSCQLPAGPSYDDIGAPRVIAGLRASFRSCYNAGLSLDPAMSGRVTLVAKVAPNGEVAEAAGADGVGLSSSVVQCLSRKLRTAQFEPGHGTTTLRIPVAFVQQREGR